MTQQTIAGLQSQKTALTSAEMLPVVDLQCLVLPDGSYIVAEPLASMLSAEKAARKFEAAKTQGWPEFADLAVVCQQGKRAAGKKFARQDIAA